MIKLGVILTGYLILSFVIFLLASPTVNGGIIYGLFLLPIYGIVLLVGWIILLKNQTKTAQLNYGVWFVVFILQTFVILTSPGNCYLATQGASCYSNLQVFFGNVPRLGMTDMPHWTIVENAFYGLLVAYCIALAIGLWSTSFKTNHKNDNDPK